MNTQPLTPTHARSHAPAIHLLQAKVSLKDLLSEDDIEFLVDYDGSSPLWSMAAAQKNGNADRFLSGLKIREWDIDEFVKVVVEKASQVFRHISSPPYYVSNPDQAFLTWLSDKPIEWLQKFYALLYAELGPSGGCRRLRDAKIIRLSDGRYSSGSTCFFPGNGIDHDEVLPRVDASVYTSGKSKSQQDNARTLLSEIGVRDVGEAEQVEAILRTRYIREADIPDKETYFKDLKRFIALVEREPDRVALFTEYFIFDCKNDQWCQPSSVFLDQPFLDTGLGTYYEPLSGDANRIALSDGLQECGIAVKRLVKFAEAVGAQTQLEISEASCHWNPQWPHLCSVGGDRHTSPIDRDYVIPRLEELMLNPSLALSKLLWRTMSSLSPNYLLATFQRNRSWGPHLAESQLVHHLRAAKWIPQGNGSFVRPSEASRDLLPDGFAFDPGWRWLKSIQFGNDVAKRSEEQRQKKLWQRSWALPTMRALSVLSNSRHSRRMIRYGFLRSLNAARRRTCQTRNRAIPSAAQSAWVCKLPMRQNDSTKSECDPCRSAERRLSGRRHNIYYNSIETTMAK
jgi:hypothetical protein